MERTASGLDKQMISNLELASRQSFLLKFGQDLEYTYNTLWKCFRIILYLRMGCIQKFKDLEPFVKAMYRKMEPYIL